MAQLMRNRMTRMPLLVALANGVISLAQSSPDMQTPNPPTITNTTSSALSNNSSNTPEPLPVTTVSLLNNGQIPLPTPDSLNWTDPCAILPLEASTWSRLNLDQYLANYPGGQNYTLTDYALSVSVQNWVCGIGETCDAQQVSGLVTSQPASRVPNLSTISLQPCNPIPGPQWEVLYAVQNWNLVQNTLYNAIGMAVSMTQSITSALVTDLYHPAKRSPLWKWNDIFSIAGGIAALIASVVMVYPGTLLAIGIWYSINAIIATGEGAVGIMLLDKDKKDEPDPFQRWSEFAWYLGKWQSLAQGTLNNRTTDIINAGISTPQGISGVLKNGTYFRRIEARQFQQVESEIKFTATARILNAVIRDYGGFVAVQEGCQGKGANGASSNPDTIQFCYPNKTMMSVIRQKHGHPKNTWYHGSLINSTYGFTAEYLTTQSWNCQMKFGKPEFNPYNETAVPTDRSADCIINLPVCDTRIPAIRQAVQKHGIVKGCRDVGKLPI